MFVSLKPLAERQASADEVIARLRRDLAQVAEDDVPRRGVPFPVGVSGGRGDQREHHGERNADPRRLDDALRPEHPHDQHGQDPHRQRRSQPWSHGAV